MKRFKIGFGLFLMIITVLLLANPGFSALLPIESNITVNAYTTWNTTPPITVIQSDSDSQGASINPLSASATAYVTDGSGNSYQTSVEINASWNDATSGSVSFVGSLDITSTGSTADFSGDFDSGGPNIWTYTFTPDVDGSIILEWDTWYTWLSFEGIPPFHFLNGNGYWDNLNSDDPDPLIISNISAGMPFTFGLGWIYGGHSLVGQGDSTLYETGDFDWQFVPNTVPNPVPNPSTVWLLGLALIGLVEIRRRIKKV